MLKTRIVTAAVLLTVLILVLLSRSFVAFAILVLLFFAAAAWENFRLFDERYAIPLAGTFTVLFAMLIYLAVKPVYIGFAFFAVIAWIVFLAPSLVFPMPVKHSIFDRFFELVYFTCIISAFLAFLYLYESSLILLLSVLFLVNIADIGAYFAGRAFGRHKLAPSISPGKTWEGAVGGCVAVILAAVITVFIPGLEECITVKVYSSYGWFGMIIAMILIVGMSIDGDLLESRLKRRREFKDSSNLLPGHGGVLDRIDSLIPTMPLAVLLHIWS